MKKKNEQQKLVMIYIGTETPPNELVTWQIRTTNNGSFIIIYYKIASIKVCIP